MTVRLEWEGKPKQVERLSLPFQTVETINESRATRERDAGSLLQPEARGTTWPQPADLGRQQARDEQPARGVRRRDQADLHRSAVRHRRRLLVPSSVGDATSSRSPRSSRSTLTGTRGAAGGRRTYDDVRAPGPDARASQRATDRSTSTAAQVSAITSRSSATRSSVPTTSGTRSSGSGRRATAMPSSRDPVGSRREHPVLRTKCVTPCLRQYTESNPEYIAAKCTHTEPDGRRYRLDNLTSPATDPTWCTSTRDTSRRPRDGRFRWRRMQEMDAERRLYIPDNPERRMPRTSAISTR